MIISSQTIAAQNLTASADPIPSFLLDVIVVTATRTETAIKNVGSSITGIAGAEIERSGQTSVSEILRELAGPLHICLRSSRTLLASSLLNPYCPASLISPSDIRFTSVGLCC